MKSRFILLTTTLFIDALQHMQAVHSPNTRIVFQNYFDSKDEECYLLLVSAQWDDSREDDTMNKWVDSMIEKTPSEMGAAVNFSPANVPLSELFGEDDVARLASLKKRWDPQGFFNRSTIIK
jgi:hypothetical protein